MRKICVLVLITWSAIASAASDAPAPDMDAAVTARVEAALRNRELQGIEVQTQEGVVQLSGFVDSAETQETALMAARAVEGIETVRNDLVVKEAEPETRSAPGDTVIAARVRNKIQQDVNSAASDINVEVSGGVVQLSGFVDNVAEKNRAADVASSVRGVQDVRNDIALARN